MIISESRIRRIIREEIEKELHEGFMDKALDTFGRSNSTGKSVRARAKELLYDKNIADYVNTKYDMEALQKIPKMGDNEAAGELELIQRIERNKKERVRVGAEKAGEAVKARHKAEFERHDTEQRRVMDRKNKEYDTRKREEDRRRPPELVAVGEDPYTGEVLYTTRSDYDRGSRNGSPMRDYK